MALYFDFNNCNQYIPADFVVEVYNKVKTRFPDSNITNYDIVFTDIPDKQLKGAETEYYVRCDYWEEDKRYTLSGWGEDGD